VYSALCLFRDQFSHIYPVEEFLKDKVKFTYSSSWQPNEIDELRPNIVIGINEHHSEIANCYEAAAKLNIPTLTLQDGILEWRYLFENPMHDGNSFGVPLYTPVIADKLACIGNWWAHLIGAMGNHDKVEVTGMPKMDVLSKTVEVKMTPRSGERRKVLIVTAAKPWFNDDQKRVVLAMLSNLVEYFDANKDIEPIWRITKGLDKEIGINNSYHQKDSTELAELIVKSDAVISTISTAMVETLILGKPLAKLDYFNTPNVFPTVWNITHKGQIHEVVSSLLSNSNKRLYWQEILKNVIIANVGQGAKKVADLILAMIEFRSANPLLKFPSEMLKSSHASALSNAVDFMNRKTLQHNDIDWLKARVMRLERENAVMKAELKQRSMGGILLNAYGKIKKRLW